jgi:Ca-activated chloride channel homolog
MMFTATTSTRLMVLALLLTPTLAEAQRSGLWPQGGQTSLKLVRHDVQVRIHQPLAELTVTQEFDNPSSRQLEAYYYYPVPQGATVTNLALWVNGVRREARVMERQKAREIYQGIVNQKRDPALVERLSDGLFRIRIFPVPARGRMRVELRFAQPLELLEPGHYRLLLRKPPGQTSHALRLGVELRPAATPQRAWLVGYSGQLARQTAAVGPVYALPMAATQRSFERDIEVHFTLPRQSAARIAVAAKRSAEASTFVAELPRAPDRGAPRQVSLLVDVSAGMQPHLPRARRLVEALLRALPAWGKVQLLPFDILPRAPEADSATMAQVSPARVGALTEWLEQQEAARGTAFVPAFEAALRAGAHQIILVTDGASPNHQAELEQLLRRVFDHRGLTISVVLLGSAGVTGTLPQLDPLRDMVRITGGVFEKRSGGTRAQLVKRLLSRPQPRSARLLAGEAQIQGASLHVLSGASPQRVLVAGRLPAGANNAPLRISLSDGSSHELRLPAGDVRAAGALWANAEIGRLMQQIKLFNEEDALRPQIIALSKEHRVASEYTAYLVTETDADYLRPTSGRKWQRQVQRMGDGAPQSSFHSTPEPHEVLLVGLGLLLVWAARRRGWLGAS